MKIAGTPVTDAKNDLRLHITKLDVRSGAKKNADACAAANALCRQEGCTEAKVHFTRAYIKKGKTWVRYYVPPALRSEIVAFDRGGTFEAGDYELKAMPPNMIEPRAKSRGINKTKRKSHANKGLMPKAVHITTGVRERMKVER
jgi:hypothetical protein